jgi:hypothetical protein
MYTTIRHEWQAWTGSPMSTLTAPWSDLLLWPRPPFHSGVGASLEQSVGGVDRVILTPEVRVNTAKFVFCSASLAVVVHLLPIDV